MKRRKYSIKIKIKIQNTNGFTLPIKCVYNANKITRVDKKKKVYRLIGGNDGNQQQKLK